VIEGVAEAANSVLKIVSGRLADLSGAPKPLVLAGYGLSSAVRPFIGLAASWTHVLALRFTDRLGKGIRGAPRDVMLATFADASNRGRIFGFHRAMDHAGAVCGPLLASAFLYVNPGEYRTLFALTIVPGIVVILILLRVPDTRRERPSPDTPGSALGAENTGLSGNGASDVTTPAILHAASKTSPDLLELPSAFYQAMAVILLFSLGNASDAFLLLRFADVGIAPFWIPLLWSAIHVVSRTRSGAGASSRWAG
jgi:hypothetical protein